MSNEEQTEHLPVTDWFDPSDKPVHLGTYSRMVISTKTAYWDGEQWREEEGGAVSDVQDLYPWRGLAEDPSPPPVIETPPEPVAAEDCDDLFA